MRAFLASAVAAVAITGLAPAANATCMPLWDAVLFYSYSCAAPGEPSTTYTCFRPTGECWSQSSGGGGWQ